METFYIVILAFLVCLAVFDLFVGVSNDAVNFLNSALGCRIASFKTTMIVTSFGVLLGATFSSGMMEVARSGVFHPQMFSFHEIMIIFFAVMVADIILLDTFNSLGLPTSTTVSIVFELLGSAIAAAAYQLFSDGASLAMVIDYINSSKALAIISGILISVVVAFITGAVVQYIARLVFTFHFEHAWTPSTPSGCQHPQPSQSFSNCWAAPLPQLPTSCSQTEHPWPWSLTTSTAAKPWPSSQAS